MAKIVNPRSVRARERWARIIEEQGRSGLGVRAFCRKRGVGEHSFYAWRRSELSLPAGRPGVPMGFRRLTHPLLPSRPQPGPPQRLAMA